MEKDSPHKTKSAVKLPENLRANDDYVQHFFLTGLLPPGHILALNTRLGTLSQLSRKEQQPLMLMEQQFTTSEICLLLLLLESYPYYCSYDALLAAFNCGRVTDAAIEESRKRLREAAELGVWDQEMRPVRNVLSRTRLKMRLFHIEITSIVETGYMLIKARVR